MALRPVMQENCSAQLPLNLGWSKQTYAPKTNIIDTNNDGLENVSPFNLDTVAMLDFRGVYYHKGVTDPIGFMGLVYLSIQPGPVNCPD